MSLTNPRRIPEIIQRDMNKALPQPKVPLKDMISRQQLETVLDYLTAEFPYQPWNPNQTPVQSAIQYGQQQVLDTLRNQIDK